MLVLLNCCGAICCPNKVGIFKLFKIIFTFRNTMYMKLAIGSNIPLVNKFNYAINFQFVWKPVMSGMEKTCCKFHVSDIFPVHTQMYAQHVYKKLLDSSRQNYKTSKNIPVRWFSTWEWADWSLLLKFSSAYVSWSKQMTSLDEEWCQNHNVILGGTFTAY